MKTLYCVHVNQPEELRVCESEEAAKKEAAEWNRFFQDHEMDGVTATVKPWPHSPEEHTKAAVARLDAIEEGRG